MMSYRVGNRISFVPGRPRWWRHPIKWWRWPKEEEKRRNDPKYAFYITKIEPHSSITIMPHKEKP